MVHVYGESDKRGKPPKWRGKMMLLSFLFLYKLKNEQGNAFLYFFYHIVLF